MKAVTISFERYKELLNAEKTLTALNNGGVSNWDWYGESLEGCEDVTDEEALRFAEEDKPKEKSE